MNKRLISILLGLCIIVSMLPISVVAVTATQPTGSFAGGSGTQADPFLIKTKDHLNNIRNNLDAHYKMISDIVFADEDFAEGGAFYNKGTGWEPIGSSNDPFTGSFDGNNKTVRNIHVIVNASTSPYAGIFGYCKGSSFQNVNTENGNVEIHGSRTPYLYSGGLVGYASSCEFVNCTNGNNVTANSVIMYSSIEPYVYVGGITAYGGSFASCSNTGTIQGKTSAYNADYDYAYCGGITGQSTGIIEACLNEGDVFAASESASRVYQYVYAAGIVAKAGSNVMLCSNGGTVSITATNDQGTKGAGIVAFASPDTTVSQCYNTGLVTGPYSGGVVGTAYKAKITNCYNAGSITGASYAGGIVSYVTSNGTVSNCYNVGNVNKSVRYAYIGGITGYMSSGTSTNCYYLDTISSGTGRGIATTSKKDVAAMQEKSTFAGFDFVTIWELKEKNYYPYPTLINNAFFDGGFAGGSGSELDPYLIKTKEHLNNVRNDLGAHYQMIADISFTPEDFCEAGEFYSDGQGWRPIGTDYNSPFTGSFDGNGYQISNLYINITRVPENGQVFAGLFGYGDGCRISNLSLTETNISVNVEDAAVSVGAILGRTDEFGQGATIIDCSNDGEIYASIGYVGGIAGSVERGMITSCKNSGSIDAATAGCGGIIGYLNQVTVADCQNYSNIGGKSRVVGNCGGIASYSFGSILSSSNYGKIISEFEAGGVVCSAWGLIDTCRNDGEITAKYSTGGIVSVGATMHNAGIKCGINNCINNGTIISGTASDDMYHIKAGGIAGSIQDGIVVSNSWNHGAVLAQSDFELDCNAGGIIGYNAGGSIWLCGNTGDIVAKTVRYARAGGIVGCNCGGNTPVTVDQCINLGAIMAPIGGNGVCGGIAGDNYDVATISNCFNTGGVTTSSRPGGIVGLINYSTVSVMQCYNIGILTTTTPNQWIEGVEYPHLEHCFYLDTSDYTSLVVPGYASGTALNASEMLDQASFYSFDFDSIWTMEGDADYPYPELQKLSISIDCIDDNGDFWCDVCSAAIPHECVDEDGDFNCDLCHRECNSEEEHLLGDINGDGKVNIADVSRLYAHVRGTNILTDEDVANRCDISGDGKINVADVSKLYAYVRGTGKLH